MALARVAVQALAAVLALASLRPREWERTLEPASERLRPLERALWRR